MNDDDDNNNNNNNNNNNDSKIDKVINFVIRVDELNILLQKRLESRHLERKSLVRILSLNLRSLKKKRTGEKKNVLISYQKIYHYTRYILHNERTFQCDCKLLLIMN